MITRDLHVTRGTDYTTEFPALDDRNRPLVGWRVSSAVRWRDGGADVLYMPAVRLVNGVVTMRVPGSDSIHWVWHRVHYDVTLRGPRGEMRRLARGRLIAE